MDGSSPPGGQCRLASFTRPRVDDAIRLAVIGDPHLAPQHEGSPKVYHQATDRFAAALKDAERRHADAVISVGDLTKDGAPVEYDAVDECLTSLDCPFYAVPGNHDVQKSQDDHRVASFNRFVTSYTPGSLPFQVSVGHLDLVGLNTASLPDGSLQDHHGGAVREATLDWLDELLPATETPLVICHHNTPAMADALEAYRKRSDIPPPPSHEEAWSFFIRNGHALVNVLRRHDVPLVVTGHLHTPGVADNDGVWELTAPATGSFPQSYLLIDIEPTGTTVWYVPVPTIAGMTESFAARQQGTKLSRFLAGFASIQLASAPLGDASVRSDELEGH